MAVSGTLENPEVQLQEGGLQTKDQQEELQGLLGTWVEPLQEGRCGGASQGPSSWTISGQNSPF